MFVEDQYQLNSNLKSIVFSVQIFLTKLKDQPCAKFIFSFHRYVFNIQSDFFSTYLLNSLLRKIVGTIYTKFF